MQRFDRFCGLQVTVSKLQVSTEARGFPAGPVDFFAFEASSVLAVVGFAPPAGGLSEDSAAFFPAPPTAGAFAGAASGGFAAAPLVACGATAVFLVAPRFFAPMSSSSGGASECDPLRSRSTNSACAIRRESATSGERGVLQKAYPISLKKRLPVTASKPLRLQVYLTQVTTKASRC